jgi:hypothetical protein
MGCVWVSYGQSRVQVVWNRVILLDTSSFQLDKLVGTDPAGYAGLDDGVLALGSRVRRRCGHHFDGYRCRTGRTGEPQWW